MAKSSKKTVMVVEDEADIAGLIRTYLELEDYNVIIAPVGVQSLLERDFWTWVDVAIIDAMMPFIPGEAILSFLATNLPGVRRVLCTASMLASERLVDLTDAVLTKPFTKQELLIAVGGGAS